MSIPSCGGSWLAIWRPLKSTNFKNSLNPLLTNDTILEKSVFPTKRNQLLKNDERFMESEKVINDIYREF